MDKEGPVRLVTMNLQGDQQPELSGLSIANLGSQDGELRRVEG